MNEARRRLLHLGIASAATGLALPATSWAKGHAGGRKSAAHAIHKLARQSLHRHAHEHPFAKTVQQASIQLGDAPRRLKFHNLHTDEKLDALYWENGQYVPSALNAVNHVLRDFRTGDVHMMDPALLDLMVAVSAKVETSSPVYVISGYRSPQTNSMLRAEGGEATGVAKKSLHLQGQAIDLRFADVQLSHLHAAALSLGRGGVGYYPTSDFVHMDVGPVRQWAGV
jgi:uncharacterized protein YcbK (DUF882 family)